MRNGNKNYLDTKRKIHQRLIHRCGERVIIQIIGNSRTLVTLELVDATGQFGWRTGGAPETMETANGLNAHLLNLVAEAFEENGMCLA